MAAHKKQRSVKKITRVMSEGIKHAVVKLCSGVCESSGGFDLSFALWSQRVGKAQSIEERWVVILTL